MLFPTLDVHTSKPLVLLLKLALSGGLHILPKPGALLLFGLQAETILTRPGVIVLIAIPLLLQSYAIFAVAYGWAWIWRIPFSTAAPAALIGTSNFFELAVAVAISLFGLNSGAALATVVGVLVEVPVMLSLVAFANATRNRFAEPEPATRARADRAGRCVAHRAW